MVFSTEELLNQELRFKFFYSLPDLNKRKDHNSKRVSCFSTPKRNTDKERVTSLPIATGSQRFRG